MFAPEQFHMFFLAEWAPGGVIVEENVHTELLAFETESVAPNRVATLGFAQGPQIPQADCRARGRRLPAGGIRVHPSSLALHASPHVACVPLTPPGDRL